MKKRLFAILGSGLLASTFLMFGQRGMNPIPKDDLQIANEQAEKIFSLTDALGATAGKSTVVLYNQGGRLCYGISIGDEKVIAKWSDLIGKGDIYASQGDDKSLEVKPLGYYSDQDLVVLKVSGLTAPAMIWESGEDLEEGRMLISVNAKGQGTALGVVSVGVRSLRAEEEGFLGVEMDSLWEGTGIKVRAVTVGGAAEEAGLKAGDVITFVDDKKVDGLLEMQTRIRRFRAGDVVNLRVQRNEAELRLEPTLKGYELGGMRESRRLRQMDRMSGGVSRVRDNFPSVLQSDLELNPEDSGSPVIDLDGKVVGMVIARADRVSTLVLPAEEIQRVLKTEPDLSQKPQIAQQRVIPSAREIGERPSTERNQRFRRSQRDAPERRQRGR